MQVKDIVTHWVWFNPTTSDTSCHAISLPVGGVRIDDRIYWPFIHTTRNYKQLQRDRWSPQFTNYNCISYAFSSLLSSSTVTWQQLLTLDILQLHALRFYLYSPCTEHSHNWIFPLFITSRHGLHRKHRSSNVTFVSVEAGTCSPSRCSETAAARTTEITVLLLLRACLLRALPKPITRQYFETEEYLDYFHCPGFRIKQEFLGWNNSTLPFHNDLSIWYK
jgi:hypothetical protein